MYDCHPTERTTLPQAMDEAGNDFKPDLSQTLICNAKRCMNKKDIYFDFDENLCPNAQDRLDAI